MSDTGIAVLEPELLAACRSEEEADDSFVSAEDTEASLRALLHADPRWIRQYEPGWTVLGSGSCATVVRARCRDRGMDFAVKIFHRPIPRKRFRQEIQSALAADSPYAVRVHAPCWGMPAWLEMEFVDGITLRDELERRAGEPFPVEDALEMGIALATALRDAHRKGIVHRDVKPANIMLPRSRQPILKLIDFGVSRLEGAAISRSGWCTPQFAAPETFLGDEEPGRPADIYSLGLCLFMIFTGGRFPWQLRGEPDTEFFVGLHISRPPLPARALVPDIDSLLDFTIHACLAKQCAKRPRADQVLAALLEIRGR
jgi:serine/threonine-protein kinase